MPVMRMDDNNEDNGKDNEDKDEDKEMTTVDNGTSIFCSFFSFLL
jgi:hypothetical protein